MKLSLPFDSEHLDAKQIEEHIERLSIILDKYALSRIEYEIDDTRIAVEKTAGQQPGSALVLQDLQWLQGLRELQNLQDLQRLQGIQGTQGFQNLEGTGAPQGTGLASSLSPGVTSSDAANTGIANPGLSADMAAHQKQVAKAPGSSQTAGSSQATGSTQAAGSSQTAGSNTTPAHMIYAPLVGIAYRSREPGSPPFVEVGDAVEEGTTLCLVEAMKMFNEVKSPISGVISEIHFEDSKLVEHGAPLFSLR